MQPREEKSILIEERAFAPAPMPLAEPDWYSKLYLGDDPEYGKNLVKGTVKDLENLTLEESNILKTLNLQFFLLIKNIHRQCLALGIKDEALIVDNIRQLQQHYTSRTFYPNQSNDFYIQLKHSLEAVAYHLSHNSLLNTHKKKQIMEDLLAGIAGCATDALQRIEIAMKDLSICESIDAWLADFRLTLIQQAARHHVKRSFPYKGNEIHAETVFLKYADEQGWAPYGVEIRENIKHNFANLTEIKREELKIFENWFLQQYNPAAIMRQLAARLHNSIITRLQEKCEKQPVKEEKEERLVIPENGGFLEFFAGIPLNETGLKIEDVFYEAQDEGVASFRYTNRWYSLKSISQLMLSMTRAFAREGTNIFETYQDNYYTLVPGYPELCHQHSEETPPLASAKLTLKWMKKHTNAHFNHLLFHSLYQSGIRDFSDCTLYQVDFSGCVIEELILHNTHVPVHSKITPEQFIALFRRDINLLPFKSDIENRVPFECNAQSISEKTADDKDILFFYGVFLNNLSMIELLAKENIDTRKKDIFGRTAIAYAIEFNRWEGIIKFIGKKEPAAEASTYWDEIKGFICESQMVLKDCSGLLPYAARDNQLSILEKLLTLFPFIINQRSEVGSTALHYAAKEGHHEIVKFLLDKYADDTIKAEKDDPKTTPLAYAAAHGKWECVKELIPKESKTIDGYIVALAVKDNRHKLVMRLLREKFILDINIRVDEKTALHYAVQHAVEHKNEKNAAEHKNEENAAEHRGEEHAVPPNPVDMVRSLLAAGAHDDFSLLINTAIRSNKIDLAILLFTQNIKYNKTHPLVGKLHELTQTYHFSPEIKKYFLNFYKALEHDTTSEETKTIILQHLIDILNKKEKEKEKEKEEEEEEEKDQVRDQKNSLLLQKILDSEQDLKNKLNGKPPMSLPLKIALGTLFGGIATLLVGSVAIYLVGVAGIEIGSLILPCFISSLVTGVPISCYGYFRHKEYNEKKARNNTLVDTMIEHFRPLSPS
jgi:ankyrin repeat protein